MVCSLPSLIQGVQNGLDRASGTLQALGAVLSAGARLAQAVRSAIRASFPRAMIARPSGAYETLWLEMVLDLNDVQGRRAVLARRQRVRFLVPGGSVVRELVWGEGDQVVRYTARGARKLGMRAEGAKSAVLLDPDLRPAVGDELTISSRRAIRGGFIRREEYCEALLERPTGRLDLVVLFPTARPPRSARLVSAGTEQVLRALPVRYRADGRAVLHCRLHKPAIATVYSLRWSW